MMAARNIARWRCAAGRPGEIGLSIAAIARASRARSPGLIRLSSASSSTRPPPLTVTTRYDGYSPPTVELIQMGQTRCAPGGAG
jgi:hypothetical protein